MFDPYHKWLGIPKGQRPPTWYQLLSIAPDEQDVEVIEEAAIRQSTHLRSYQIGEHSAECTRLLNEISQARTTLLNPDKRKKYDDELARTAPRPKSEGVTAKAPRTAANARLDEPDEETRRPAKKRLEKKPALPVLLLAGAGAGLFVVVGVVILLVVLLMRRPTPTPNPPVAGGGPASQPRVEPPKKTPPPMASEPVKKTTPWPQDPGVVRVPEEVAPAVPNLSVSRWTAVALSSSPGKALLANDGQSVACFPSPENVLVSCRVDNNQFFPRRTPWNVGPARCLAFSPDSKLLILATHSGAGQDGDEDKALVVPFGQANVLREFTFQKAPILCAAVSQDGRAVVTAGTLAMQGPDPLAFIKSSICLWDLATGQGLRRLDTKSRGPVLAVAFAPDGSAIYVCDSATVHVWDLVTNTAKHHVVPGDQLASTAAFSRDGRRLITRGEATGETRFHPYQLQPYSALPPRALKGFKAGPFDVSWDGHYVLTSTVPLEAKAGDVKLDCPLVLFDVDTGAVVGRTRRSIGQATSVSLAQPDAVVSVDKRLERFGIDALNTPIPKSPANPVIVKENPPPTDPEGDKRLADHPEEVATTFNPNLVLVGDKNLQLFDLTRKMVVRTFGKTPPRGRRVRLAVSPDRKSFFAARDPEPIINRYDLETGDLLGTLVGHTAPCTELALSADGKYLLSGSHDNTLRLWDTTEMKEVAVLQGHDSPPRRVAISPDGRIGVSSSDRQLIAWDLQAHKPMNTVTLEGIQDAKFTPDGKSVVALTLSRDLITFSASPFQRIGSTHDDRFAGGVFGGILFTPDGRHLLYKGVRGTVLVLEWPNLKEVQTIEAYPQVRVNSMALTLNGSHVFTLNNTSIRSFPVIGIGKFVPTN